MGLENRLTRLELKMKLLVPVVEVPFNVDDCIVKMGLDPAGIRESARQAGSSLAEAISLALGIEPMRFVRLLKEKANMR